jgi:hypothetical protein
LDYAARDEFGFAYLEFARLAKDGPSAGESGQQGQWKGKHPEEALANLLLGDEVWGFVAKPGKVGNGPEVGFLGAFRPAMGLQVFQHSLT